MRPVLMLVLTLALLAGCGSSETNTVYTPDQVKSAFKAVGLTLGRDANATAIGRYMLEFQRFDTKGAVILALAPDARNRQLIVSVEPRATHGKKINDIIEPDPSDLPAATSLAILTVANLTVVISAIIRSRPH